MVTFEGLFPIRLAEVIGDTAQAAALMGPVELGGVVRVGSRARP